MASIEKVVISGASSGIGLALARHYLERGAIVAAFARRSELLQALAAEFPHKVFCYALDVRNAAAIQNAAQDFMTRVGVPDIVIANAGVSRGTLTEYAEDIDAFQQVMDINVLGMVKTFQPFLSAMRANSSPDLLPPDSGRVAAKQRGTHRRTPCGCKGGVGGLGRPRVLVGIASVAGFRGLPGAGAYSASKAAAISYLESLRVELRGSGVKVVTICPGYIKTPMTAVNPYPMPFILDVDDAAKRMALVIERGCSFSVIPWQMGLVGSAMKLLPNWLYDLILKRAPYKPRNF